MARVNVYERSLNAVILNGNISSGHGSLQNTVNTLRKVKEEPEYLLDHDSHELRSDSLLDDHYINRNDDFHSPIVSGQELNTNQLLLNRQGSLKFKDVQDRTGIRENNKENQCASQKSNQFIYNGLPISLPKFENKFNRILANVKKETHAPSKKRKVSPENISAERRSLQCKKRRKYFNESINNYDNSLLVKKQKIKRNERRESTRSTHSLTVKDDHCNLRSNQKFYLPFMKCDICGLSFDTEMQLKNHKTHYTRSCNFVCNVCNLSFAWQYQLTNHKRSAHFTTPTRVLYKFTCDCCKQKFQKKTALQAHLFHFHDWNVSNMKNTYQKELTNKASCEKEYPIQSFNEFKEIYKKKSDLPNVIELLNLPSENMKMPPLTPIKVQNSTLSTLGKQHRNKEQNLIQTKFHLEFIKKRTVPFINISEEQNPIQINKQAKNQLNSFDLKEEFSALLNERHEEVKMYGASNTVEEKDGETILENLPNNQRIIADTKVPSTHQENNEISGNNIQIINSSESSDEDVSIYVDTVYQDSDRMQEKSVIENETGYYIEDRYALTDSVPVGNSDETYGHINDISMVEEVETDKYIGYSNRKQDAVTSKGQTNSKKDLNVLMKFLKNSNNLQLCTSNTLTEMSNNENILSQHRDSFYKCKDISVPLIRIDEFLNAYTPSLVSCKKENTENHTLMKGDTSRALPLELLRDNLSSSQSDETESLNQIELKEINIPLVRLENMSDVVEPEKNLTNIRRSVFDESVTFPCNVCDEVFSSKKRRKNHIKSVHTAYLSSICNARFIQKQTLLYHYLYRHTVLGSNKCCVCQKSYAHQMNLKRHLLLHCIKIIESKQNQSLTDSKDRCTSINNKHKCLPGCGRQFWLPTSLKIHQNECELWKNIASNSQNGSARVSDVIDDPVQSSNIFEMQNTKSKNFAQNRHFKRNLAVGTSLKHRSYTNLEQSKNALTKYRKGNLPHGKNTDLQNYLSKPEQRSIVDTKKEKKVRYPCVICNTQFFTLKNLELHQQLYLQPLTILCHICGFMFPSKMVLIFHIRATHNTLRKYKLQCSVCGQGFFKKEYLRIHTMHFHFNAIVPKIQSTLDEYFKVKQEPDIENLVDKDVKYKPWCNVCTLTFKSYSSFISHRIYYSKRGTFTCSSCVRQFNGKYMFDHHRKTVHESAENYGYICTTCSEGFTSDSELLAHKGHFHGEDLSRSRLRFNNDVDTLKRNAVKLEVCSICNMNFSTTDQLLLHQVEYSNYGDFSCNKCDRKCWTVSSLEEHQRLTHTDNVGAQTYKCNICSEVLTNDLTLAAHAKHFHKTVNDQSFDNTGDELKIDVTSPTGSNHSVNNSLKCHTCGQEFEKELSLKNHTMEYSNDGEYACIPCKRWFSSLSCLEHHNSKHARLGVTSCYRFQCPICSEGFMTPTSLHAHGMHLHGFQFIDHIFAGRVDRNEKASVQDVSTNSHSDSRSSIIKTVGELLGPVKVKTEEEKIESYYSSILQNVNLKSLIAETCRVEENVRSEASEESTSAKVPTITERKLYSCDACNYQFDDKRNLVKHIQRYSNDGKFHCKICDRRFMWSTLYEYHERKHFTKIRNKTYKHFCAICNENFRDAMSGHAHMMHLHKSSENMGDGKKKKTSLENSQINSVLKSNGTDSSRNRELVLDLVESSAQHEFEPDEVMVLPNKEEKDIIIEDVKEPTLNNTAQQPDPLAVDLHCPETLSAVSTTSNNSNNALTENRSYETSRNKTSYGNAEQLFQSELHVANIISLEQMVDSCLEDVETYPSKIDDPLQFTLNNSNDLVTTCVIEDENSINSGNRTKEEIDASVSKIHEEHRYVKVRNVHETFDCDICKQVFATAKALSKHRLSCIASNSVAVDLNYSKNDDNSWFYVTLSDTSEQPEQSIEINSKDNDGATVISKDTRSSSVQEIQDDDVIIVETNRASQPNVEIIVPNNIDSSKQTTPLESKDQMAKRTAIAVHKNAVHSDTEKVGKLKVKPFAKIIENLTLESISKYNKSDESSDCILVPQSAKDSTSNVRQETNYTSNASVPQNQELQVALYVSQLGRYNLSKKMQLSTVTKPSNSTVTTLTSPSQPISKIFPLKVQGNMNESRGISGVYLISKIPELSRITKVLPSQVPTSKTSSVRSSSSITTTTNLSSSASYSPSSSLSNKEGKNLSNSSQLATSNSTNASSSQSNINSSSSSSLSLSSIKSTQNLTINKTSNIRMNLEFIYKCRVCSRLFPRKIDLTKHMTTCKDQQCTVCGLKFSSEIDLEVHLLRHASVSCQTCNKEFLSEDAFNCHLSNHGELPKNYCNLCNKTLPVGTNMEDHLLHHSSAKQIKCGLCMHEFYTVSDVAKHFKLVHCIYKCSICLKRCSKRQTLEMHMISIHGISKCEIRYCENCEMGFQDEAHLRNHVCDTSEETNSNYESTQHER